MTRKPLQLRPLSQPAQVSESATQEPAPERVPQPVRPDRQNKKIIAGHFPKSTWTQFRMLCAKEDKTAQELLEEALTDLFTKYQR
jgi:hypothetical protein